MKIKRYDTHAYGYGTYESDDGDLVYWDDVEPILNENEVLRREIRRLEGRMSEIRKLLFGDRRTFT